MVDFDIYFKDPESRSYDELEEFMFEQGFDDANFGSSAGVYVLSFESKLKDIANAIKTAWKRVADAGLGPFGIGPDDLVNASEISRRWGVTREAVSKAIRKNYFPTPVHVVAGTPMWSWLIVADSLMKRNKINHEQYEFANRIYEVTQSKGRKQLG